MSIIYTHAIFHKDICTPGYHYSWYCNTIKVSIIYDSNICSALRCLVLGAPYNDSVWSVPQSRTTNTTCVAVLEKFFFGFCQACFQKILVALRLLADWVRISEGCSHIFQSEGGNLLSIVNNHYESMGNLRRNKVRTKICHALEKIKLAVLVW